MSIRTEKVASVLQQALAMPLQSFAKEVGAGFVTITNVQMSADIQIAKVYLSVFQSKISNEKFLQKLAEEQPRLRHDVASQIQLRYAPELRFFIDDTLNQLDRIQYLLDKEKEKSQALGGKAYDETDESDADDADAEDSEEKETK
ncbi:MAG: 30S ribosome-binding factor RbfA [Bacteroidota bacterium]